MTWDQLVSLEPRLARLLDEIKSIKDDETKPDFCVISMWEEGGYKRRLSLLAGWHASDDVPALLQTELAYNVATKVLYAAFPACRNCGCMPAGYFSWYDN